GFGERRDVASIAPLVITPDRDGSPLLLSLTLALTLTLLMPILTLALKDLRLLLRDARSAVILLVTPLVLILVLGLSLGEGFGEKPDERLRISVVNLDRGLSTKQPFPEK